MFCKISKNLSQAIPYRRNDAFITASAITIIVIAAIALVAKLRYVNHEKWLSKAISPPIEHSHLVMGIGGVIIIATALLYKRHHRNHSSENQKKELENAQIQEKSVRKKSEKKQPHQINHKLRLLLEYHSPQIQHQPLSQIIQFPPFETLSLLKQAQSFAEALSLANQRIIKIGGQGDCLVIALLYNKLFDQLSDAQKNSSPSDYYALIEQQISTEAINKMRHELTASDLRHWIDHVNILHEMNELIKKAKPQSLSFKAVATFITSLVSEDTPLDAFPALKQRYSQTLLQIAREQQNIIDEVFEIFKERNRLHQSGNIEECNHFKSLIQESLLDGKYLAKDHAQEIDGLIARCDLEWVLALKMAFIDYMSAKNNEALSAVRLAYQTVKPFYENTKQAYQYFAQKHNSPFVVIPFLENGDKLYENEAETIQKNAEQISHTLRDMCQRMLLWANNDSKYLTWKEEYDSLQETVFQELSALQKRQPLVEFNLHHFVSEERPIFPLPLIEQFLVESIQIRQPQEKVVYLGALALQKASQQRATIISFSQSEGQLTDMIPRIVIPAQGFDPNKLWFLVPQGGQPAHYDVFDRDTGKELFIKFFEEYQNNPKRRLPKKSEDLLMVAQALGAPIAKAAAV